MVALEGDPFSYASYNQDESSRENCYLGREVKAKILRETRRMGVLAVCPLTFRKAASVDESCRMIQRRKLESRCRIVSSNKFCTHYWGDD